MKNLFIGLLMLAGTASFANTVEEKKSEKTISISSEVKTEVIVKYVKGWYDVQCGNGGSFHGYWNGTGEIYTWAAHVCDSIG